MRYRKTCKTRWANQNTGIYEQPIRTAQYDTKLNKCLLSFDNDVIERYTVEVLTVQNGTI